MQLFCVAAKSKSVMSAANFRFAVRSEADGGMKPGAKCVVQRSRSPQPGSDLAVNKKRKCCKTLPFFNELYFTGLFLGPGHSLGLNLRRSSCLFLLPDRSLNSPLLIQPPTFPIEALQLLLVPFE